MNLSELIAEKCIIVPLPSGLKEMVIRQMVEVLARSDKVVDRELVLQTVLEREKQGSTGIGNGVAIPHAKSSGVTELVGALGICPAGTDFDSLDGKLVYLVFLLEAVPDNPGPHIKALGQIARLVKTPGFVDTVLGCKTPAEVHHALRRFEMEEVSGLQGK